MMDAATGGVVLDGRRARSFRSRERITSALLELLREGNPTPSMEGIAEQAGVSRRTVFNHFRSMPLVLSELYERQLATVSERLPAVDQTGSLRERVSRYAVPYAALLESIAPVRWASHVLAATAAERAQIRAAVRHIQRVLSSGPLELLRGAGVDLSASPSLRLALEVLVDPTTYQLLRAQHGLSRAAARETLVEGILAIAEAAPRTGAVARATRRRASGSQRRAS